MMMNPFADVLKEENWTNQKNNLLEKQIREKKNELNHLKELNDLKEQIYKSKETYSLLEKQILAKNEASIMAAPIFDVPRYALLELQGQIQAKNEKVNLLEKQIQEKVQKNNFLDFHIQLLEEQSDSLRKMAKCKYDGTDDSQIEHKHYLEICIDLGRMRKNLKK